MTAYDDNIAELCAGPRGAEFLRLDLHIHSHGASHDVTDAAMTPVAIVTAAAAEGLEVIAVTDHNEIANVGAALTAGEKSGLFVVPGVELSTPEGHLLAYCPTLQALESFFRSLSIKGVGTPDSRCQTSMLDCLGLVSHAGGFCLLAHVDGGKGFDRVPGTALHKQDIISHEALLGIELVSATSEVSYDPAHENDDARRKLGQVRVSTLGEAKGRLSRVLFSDSHSLAALGRNAQRETRLTRAKMERSFHGLRLALLSPDSRIRLEDEVPASVTRVLGMRFDGGFLDGAVLRFSKNLTCIIGGRGTGKSTALEAVRSFGLRESPNSLVDSDVWPDVLHAVWEDEVGIRYCARRERGRDPEYASPTTTGPAQCPMECVGQGETADASGKAASDPCSLLALLDEFVDISGPGEQEHAQCRSLSENEVALDEARQRVGEIVAVEARLKKVKAQLAVLEAAEASKLVALERQVASQRAIREALALQAKELPSHLSLKTAHDLLNEMRASLPAVSLAGVAAHAAAIGARIDTTSADLKRIEGEAGQVASALVKALASELKDWKSKEEELTENIAAQRASLESQGVKLDLKYLKKLAAEEAALGTQLTNLSRWKSTLKALEKKRGEILAARWSARASVAAARTAFARAVSSSLRGVLKGMHVSLKYKDSCFSPEAEGIVKEAMRWRTSQVPKARLLVEGLSVPGLLTAIAKHDVAAVQTIRSDDDEAVFSRKDAAELLGVLADTVVVSKLERCIVRDMPRLTVALEDAAGGKPLVRDFSKLSLGQQQSVLLTIMLSSDRQHPLVIDQPEDNLDGEFVYRSLVPALRHAKERRQVIIVTHNANIAVLGDAEQIIALSSAPDRGEVAHQGSIDQGTTRTVACKVLEGAVEAFRRRAEAYALD